MAKYTIVGSKTVDELEVITNIASGSKFIASDSNNSTILKRINYGDLSVKLYNDVSTSISVDMLNDNFYTKNETYSKTDIDVISAQLSASLNLDVATTNKLGGIKLISPDNLTDDLDYAVQLITGNGDDANAAYVKLDQSKLSVVLAANNTIRSINSNVYSLNSELATIQQDVNNLDNQISQLDPETTIEFQQKALDVIESCTKLNGTSMRNAYLTLDQISVDNLVSWLSNLNVLSILYDGNGIVPSRINTLLVTFDFVEQEENNVLKKVLNIHAACQNTSTEEEQAITCETSIAINDAVYSRPDFSYLPFDNSGKAIQLTSIVDNAILAEYVDGGLNNAVRFLVDDTFDVAFKYNPKLTSTSGIDVNAFKFNSFNEGKIDGQLSSYIDSAINIYNQNVVQPISSKVDTLSVNTQTLSTNIDALNAIATNLSAGNGDYYAALSAQLSASIYEVFKNLFEPKQQ